MQMLANQREGTFIIRMSEESPGADRQYVISVARQNAAMHYLVERTSDRKYKVRGCDNSYNGMSELVEHYRTSGTSLVSVLQSV